MRALVLVAVFAAACAGHAGAPPRSSETLEEVFMPFEHDSSAPLLVQRDSEPEEITSHVRVFSLRFASPRGGLAPAMLVLPRAEGRYPAVLSFSFGGVQTRAHMLDEATALANAGIATMHVHAPWLREEQRGKPHVSNAYRWFEQAGVDLLCGARVLASLAEIDPSRIAYVGHGFGAHLGAMVAARAPEVKAAVFIAGSRRMSEQMVDVAHPFWRREGATEAALRAAAAEMRAIDAERFLGDVRVPVLHQFGTDDAFVPEHEARALVAATPEPKEARFYPGNHGVAHEDAREDRIAFLRRTLAVP